MIAFGVMAGCWAAGAVGALALRGRRWAAFVGAAGAVAGGVAGAVAAAGALASSSPAAWSAAWRVPAGALALRLDALGAVFLLPVAVLGALGGVYGVAYMRGHEPARSAGGSYAAYDLLLLSMALVVTAADLVLLIVAWELMTLSSWALVVQHHETADARTAGVRYLVAGHLATAALLLMVLLFAVANGGFAVAPLSPAGGVPASLVFGLALVGFGTKAGVVPLHVWLPDAHSAAPSHVSALMSGAMITMGFYGLARFLPLLGAPPAWWARLLLAFGAAGAVGGVAFSLAQRDVKRSLAYSTVENAGLATLAMGVGLLGTSLHAPVLAALGWTAALLHLWNHALAKGLLFLGFGAVAQGAHSRDLDAMGGFLRRWKSVGAIVVLGAAAIASLPGLNVFVSEWLLLRALLAGIVGLNGIDRAALLTALGALAFAGGLAVAGFTRLVGVALLGHARTPAAAGAAEPGWTMRAPMLLLGAGCVGIALDPGRVVRALAGAARLAAPGSDAGAAAGALAPLAALGPALVALVAAVLLARAAAGGRARRRYAETWGCAYAFPEPSMQYSSTSFGGGLTSVLQPVLRVRTARRTVPAEGGGAAGAAGGGGSAGALWPVAVAWASTIGDRALDGVYRPLFAGVDRAAAWLRGRHRARVTTSLVYMVATIVVLLALLFLPGWGA